MNSLKDEVDCLNKSILYNLSLSSRELFHSNFLYWLANQYEKEVGSMFLNYLGIYTENTSIKLPQREQEKVDLTLRYENDIVIVIENKVKSIPYQEQLEKYSQKPNKDTKFILLSLSKPLFFNGKREFMVNNKCKWKYLSYSEYSDILSKTFKNISTGYHKSILDDYIRFTKKLSIIDSKIEHGNEILSERDSIILKQLEEIRFDSFYKKKKYNSLMHKFKEKLEEINFKNFEIRIYDKKPKGNIFDDNIIYLKSGFSNGDAFMEFKFKVNKDIMIGTQIQGLQYRQYVHSNGKTTPDKVKKIREYADKFLRNSPPEWFTFDFNYLEIKPNKNIPRKGRIEDDYYFYSPDFFYRRVDLDKETKICDIIKSLISDIKKAIKVRNSDKK